MSNNILKLKLSHSRPGSVVELVLLLIMAAILFSAVYVYGNRLISDVATNPTVYPSPTLTETPGVVAGLIPLPTSELLPSIERSDLDYKSSDLKLIADELQELNGQVNDLDSIDNTLSLPGLEFNP